MSLTHLLNHAFWLIWKIKAVWTHPSIEFLQRNIKFIVYDFACLIRSCSTSGKLESWRTTTGGSLNRLDDPRHALLMLLALSFLHFSLTLQSYNLCFSLLLYYQWPNVVRWLLNEVLFMRLAHDKSCSTRKEQISIRLLYLRRNFRKGEKNCVNKFASIWSTKSK